MGDSTITGTGGVNVLSLHQPSKVFSKANVQETALSSSQARSAPTDFFSPNSLSSRASDLSRLQDGPGNTIRALQNAESGIARIQGLVTEAEAIARNAGALQVESANISSTVDGLEGGETLEQAFGLDSGDSITIGDGLHSVTVTADGETTVNGLISAVNADANVDVKASLYVGSLKLEATGDDGITASVTDNGGDANSLSDIGFTDLGDGVVAEAGKLSLNRLGYANDFNDILDEIDAVVKESGFNDINLLKGSSIVEKFNTNNIPTITVDGVRVDSEGLGLTTADNKFQTSVDVQGSITELDSAAVTLEGQAATFAADRTAIDVNQGISAGLINALTTGSDLTVTAPGEDVVGLLAAQTKQLLASETDSLVPSGEKDVLTSIE